jgi:hypothetical protein
MRVLLHYTLRLLTPDQLGRASTLIRALELSQHDRQLAADLLFSSSSATRTMGTVV